jgi:hypothetical protein
MMNSYNVTTMSLRRFLLAQLNAGPVSARCHFQRLGRYCICPAIWEYILPPSIFSLFLTEYKTSRTYVLYIYHSHKNDYYCKIVTYHNVLPSILAECLGERLTGFVCHLQHLAWGLVLHSTTNTTVLPFSNSLLSSCWRWYAAETGPAFNSTSKNRRENIVVSHYLAVIIMFMTPLMLFGIKT